VALGSQTDGDFGLLEAQLLAGEEGPGLHYHRTFSESFYVLSGELEIFTDDERSIAKVGDLAYVPRHGVHGFRNHSEVEDVRFLILFTPGTAREQYFEGLARLFADGNRPTIEEIDAHALLHDQVNLRGIKPEDEWVQPRGRRRPTP
jgi:mannose-6-phosphate isomerase-like protein (cupin superfamily)